MTITAIQPFYRAGVLIAAGPTQLSYSASDEGDLVRRGVAAYVGSNPQTGGPVPAKWNSTNTALVDPVSGLPLTSLQHQNGLLPNENYLIQNAEVIDWPVSPTFILTGTGSGTIDNTARNAWGGYTATLNISTTANDKTTIRSTAISLADQDIDGSPFVVVVEVISGMQENDQVILTFGTNPASDGAAYTFALKNPKHDGLHYFVVPASAMTLSGGLVWSSAMTYMQVQVKCLGTTGGQVKVHGVFRRQMARPKLIIDFDDALGTVYTQAFPYMAKYGLVGNVCIIADTVGTAGYCTEAQLDEMYAAGWDMSVHGFYAHDSGALGTYATILADVEHNRDYVAARWPRAMHHYVYPAGKVVSTDNASKSALTAAGMITARMTNYSHQVTAPWGVDDPLCLYGTGIKNNNSAALLSSLDEAISSGATCRHFGHKIPVTVSDITVDESVADWRLYVDGVATRVSAGKVDVVTISQWGRHLGLY
jgi:hypothetical protein